MQIPKQSEPVLRTVAQLGKQPEGEVLPQCTCDDPDGNGYTWWCVTGRTTYDTDIDCTP